MVEALSEGRSNHDGGVGSRRESMSTCFMRR